MRREDYAKCQRILARDPRNAAAYAMLGELLERDGKPAEALKAYEASLANDPKQINMNYRVECLQDEQALRESGQIRCPLCRTIQVKSPGRCWQCGTVLHMRGAVLQSLGYRGIIIFALLLICLVSAYVFAALHKPDLAYGAIGGFLFCILGLIINHRFGRRKNN